MARFVDIVAAGRSDIVLVLECYFDESGSHDGSEVLCVAGYIYRKEDCLNLEWQWREVLSEYGLPYFRMVDCAHGAGFFKGMGRTSRSAIARRMIDLIKKYMTFGISVSIEEAKFNTWNDAGPTLFGNAYSWCCYMCAIGVATWAKEHIIEGEIAYFFEAGHQHKKESNALMENIFDVPEFRYRSHSFIKKPEMCAIQSADILAWQSALFQKRRLHGITKPRADFLSLAERDTVTFHGEKEIFEQIHARLREYMENPTLLREQLADWEREDAAKQRP